MGKLKVAVIGNSNSVMRDSYVLALANFENIVVINHSIGSTPNVVLLDFAALETDWIFDFIIVETAVVDFLQSNNVYTEERSAYTLDLFVTYVRSRSSAEIILLTIPTRLGLLSQGANWQESVYQNAAKLHGIPILDGFRLVRRLIGLGRSATAANMARRAADLLHAFGLDRNLIPYFAWREIRDKHTASNALGTFAFVDHAHLSPAVHALVGTLIGTYIMEAHATRKTRFRAVANPKTPVIIAALPLGGTISRRHSSLISRDLVKLMDGERAIFHCPSEYVAFGLLLNRSGTNCYLNLESPGGRACLDLRYPPQPIAWNASITAIMDPVGGGIIEVTVSRNAAERDAIRHFADTAGSADEPVAELGEIILIHKDWRNVLLDSMGPAISSCNIDLAPWAEPLIHDAVTNAGRAIGSFEAEAHRIEDPCFRAAQAMLVSQSPPMAPQDRARVLLLLGMVDSLDSFFSEALLQNPGNAELTQMNSALQMLRPVDPAKSKELLRHACNLARTGLVSEADDAFADGIVRFPGEIGFFIESAWLYHHQKNWVEATQRWAKAIALFPEHHVPHLGLAMTAFSAGNKAYAVDVLDKAVSLFPDNIEVRDRLSEYRLALQM